MKVEDSKVLINKCLLFLCWCFLCSNCVVESRGFKILEKTLENFHFLNFSCEIALETKTFLLHLPF